MLTGSTYLFNIFFSLNIITPLLIVIFIEKPWEKNSNIFWNYYIIYNF